jgi:hypothetical protein
MRYRQALFCIFIVSGLSACGDRSNSVTAERTDPVKTGSSVSPVATLKEVVANDNCGINSPLPGTDVDKSKILPVWGYAINRTNWTIPESVSIRVSSMSGDHHVVVPAKRGARKDVADALGKPELENSGFGAEADLSSLPAGAYMVSVLQIIDGKTSVCNSALPIALK